MDICQVKGCKGEAGRFHLCRTHYNEWERTGKVTASIEDSGNRTQYDTGALRDRPEGKGMYVLASPIAMERIALRAEQGHRKYGDGRNWEKGMPVSEFIDSALRHIYQYLGGDVMEDHLAAAAWNLHAAMHTEQTRIDMQDIPTRYPNVEESSQVISSNEEDSGKLTAEQHIKKYGYPAMY